jgi:hypothetical protein
MAQASGRGVSASLRAQLAWLATEMDACCTDRWVLIGSAAAWLVGANVDIADIDLLTSERDAVVLMERWSDTLEPAMRRAGDDLFRSRFARFGFSPLAVEVMGDLELHDVRGWQRVRVNDIATIAVDGAKVPVPAIQAQIGLLESFGRDKDLRRAAILRAMDT